MTVFFIMRVAKNHEKSIPAWGFSNLNQTRPHFETGVALRKLEKVTSSGPSQPIFFFYESEFILPKKKWKKKKQQN